MKFTHGASPLGQHHTGLVEAGSLQEVAHRTRIVVQVTPVFGRWQSPRSIRKACFCLVETQHAPRAEGLHHRGPGVCEGRHKGQVDQARLGIVVAVPSEEMRHAVRHNVGVERAGIAGSPPGQRSGPEGVVEPVARVEANPCH